MGDRFKNFCGSLTKNFFFYFVIFYMAFHLLNGQNGIISYIKQVKQKDVVSNKLEKIEIEKHKIQNKVDRLYAESLDLDLLDEQHRRATGKILENEVIYYY